MSMQTDRSRRRAAHGVRYRRVRRVTFSRNFTLSLSLSLSRTCQCFCKYCAFAVVTADQGVRPDTSLEALPSLAPAFKPEGRITAGNSSQISDGAAALLLTDRATAESQGLPVRARIVDHLAVGVDPVVMLGGPAPATEAILTRYRSYEVNEAFASVLGMWEKELSADRRPST